MHHPRVALSLWQRLRDNFELVIVTSRQHSIAEQTRQWIDRHFPGVFSRVGERFDLFPTHGPTQACRELRAIAKKKKEKKKNFTRCSFYYLPAPKIECSSLAFHPFSPPAVFGNHWGLTGEKRTKAELCSELGARVLIDDLVDYARQCSHVVDRVIIFGEYPWNGGEGPHNAHRAADWSRACELIEAVLLPASGVSDAVQTDGQASPNP
jgi:hypothetical protein